MSSIMQIDEAKRPIVQRSGFARRTARPTAERLRERLAYDADLGEVTWKTSEGSRAQAGSLAGSITGAGYMCLRLDGCLMQLHQVIWCWMTGEYPSGDIDHKDGNRTNNAWSNLRAVANRTNRENQHMARADSVSGIQGVRLCVRRQSKGIPCWGARIRANDRFHWLGYHKTSDAAALAYRSAKSILHAGWIPLQGGLNASAQLRAEVALAVERRVRCDSLTGVRCVAPINSGFRVRIAGRHIGCFDTVEAAIAARDAAEASTRQRGS